METHRCETGRIGLIGDVHAEDGLLDSALDWLTGRTTGLILCTGDLADGPGDVGRCCELLEAAGVVVVRGNHDRWLIEGVLRDLPNATDPASLSAGTRDYFSGLSPCRRVETDTGPVLLCHGLGDNDMNRLTPDDYGYAIEVNEELGRLVRERVFRWLVHGHTHRPMVRHFGALTVINPGTLKHDEYPGVALLDLDSRLYERAELDLDGRISVTVQVPLHRRDWPSAGNRE